MATNPLAPPLTSSIKASTSPIAAAKAPVEKGEQYSRVDRQRQHNLAILASQQQVSLSAKNEPLALLFKTAIESINEQLEPSLGANAIETSVESGVDVTPQATADRIVKQATSFFTSFQQNNETLDFEQQLEKFLQVIGGGIDKGFEEARNILDSLKVLEGEVESNIDQTYELVQAGLLGFQQLQASINDDNGDVV